MDELYEDIGDLIDQCKVTFTYRKDIQSSFKEQKESNVKTCEGQTSGYAVVNCSLSYWNLAEGAASCDIDGQGTGEYSESGRCDFNNEEGDYTSVEVSQEWTYSCEGTAYFDEDEQVFKASFTIVGSGTSHTKLCDTREDVPCQDLNDTKSSRETFSGIPLTAGYTITDYQVTDDPALGTISIVEQITSADPYQPENPDPDGPCY